MAKMLLNGDDVTRYLGIIAKFGELEKENSVLKAEAIVNKEQLSFLKSQIETIQQILWDIEGK